MPAALGILRRTAFAASTLLAGLTVSWLTGVACVLCARLDPPIVQRRMSPDGGGAEGWLWRPPEGWGPPQTSLHRIDGTGIPLGFYQWHLRVRREHYVRMRNGDLRSGPSQVEIRAGWPLAGWRGRIVFVQPGGERAEPIRILGAAMPVPTAVYVRAPGWGGAAAGPEWFPVDPTGWRGLVNLGFWCGVLIAAVRGPGAVRRRWRRAHGCCAACGYPANPGSACCPECGADAVA